MIAQLHRSSWSRILPTVPHTCYLSFHLFVLDSHARWGRTWTTWTETNLSCRVSRRSLVWIGEVWSEVVSNHLRVPSSLVQAGWGYPGPRLDRAWTAPGPGGALVDRHGLVEGWPRLRVSLLIPLPTRRAADDAPHDPDRRGPTPPWQASGAPQPVLGSCRNRSGGPPPAGRGHGRRRLTAA
jgi:hypothetical protein